MPNKYIAQSAGQLTEVEALAASAGAGDAGKIPALDGAGKLDQSLMPSGIGPATTTIQASENLSAGDFVNIHNSGGPRVRKADASNGRRADGFVLGAVTSGANATVYLSGQNTGLASLTPGTTYYLGTSGAATATAPTTSGHISQEIGRAYSDTAIDFDPQRIITLA